MRLLLIGFGTVGQGLAELLIKKSQMLSRLIVKDLSVVGIADMIHGNIYCEDGIDLQIVLDTINKGKKFSELPDSFDGDTLSMIKHARADMMVEATYTDIKIAEPATSHIRTALENRMHVTTMNKGPVALYFHELNQLAKEKNVGFYYEGTVISGTPLLNMIRETLAGSEITEIKGILNGTTNYILSQMEEGMDYNDALKTAQELGYAEAVPDADVLGWDTLAKVTILANTVFGVKVKPQDFRCEGITNISLQDIANAKYNGKRYKLIGCVWKENGKVQASVAPEKIDMTHPLAGVMGVTNAVTITTDTLGDVTIVGPGAGKIETGYSALIDIIHAGGKK
ncbi:MAG: homoserine dehydrogenase [candidate division Zixibacteria bacterium]